MPDPGQLVSGPAADTLHRAVTRLRRVAMIHASWTVVIALLAASLVSLAGFGVGLLLAALGVAPAMLGTLLPPLLSVAGAMVALGLLILPLLRGRGAVAHAIRLEEATGVTGDLLSAVELHAASLDSGPSSPGDPRVSQELLSEVGRRALDLLAGIPV
ncbi:MAG: hypothetical protein FJ098_16485, partial [Deltaproteobacteria bacterium]|nr:hypothetical protein [Deltaproteobacteria bacterium]